MQNNKQNYWMVSTRNIMGAFFCITFILGGLIGISIARMISFHYYDDSILEIGGYFVFYGLINFWIGTRLQAFSVLFELLLSCIFFLLVIPFATLIASYGIEVNESKLRIGPVLNLILFTGLLFGAPTLVSKIWVRMEDYSRLKYLIIFRYKSKFNEP